MAGQVLWTIPVEEPGAKIDIRIDPGFPRHRELSAHAQRVALVVIDVEKAFRRRREVCQPTDNGALSFHDLVGIGEMEMEMAIHFRRVNYRLPSAHCYVFNTKRERNIGIAKYAMVGEVPCERPEVGQVQSPTVEGHGHTKLMLLIPLATDWQETDTLLQRELEHWPRNGLERRGLVIQPEE